MTKGGLRTALNRHSYILAFVGEQHATRATPMTCDAATVPDSRTLM